MSFRGILIVLCVVLAIGNARHHPRPPLGPRIVGGQPADIEDFPYQVSILFGGSHGCGGSIIGNRFILTAAHCTDGETEDNVSVRVGSSIVNEGGTVIKVAKINQHKQFNYDTMDYDIAVLKLASPLQYGEGVAQVDLISAGTDVRSGEMTNATGWGLLSYEGQAPTQLQQVLLPIITTKECEAFYPAGPDGVTERMFCAGYKEGGKDTCQGDSGGPLVDNDIQVGITSWGDICGDAKTPGVYTKISLFRDYIDNIVNQ